MSRIQNLRMNTNIRRNGTLLASLLAALSSLFAGCSCSQLTNPHAVRLGTDSTNLGELRKFCNLPADVQSCQWQTWSNMDDFGFGDWGLVAVVKLGNDAELAELGDPSPREHVVLFSREPTPAWLRDSTATMLEATDERGVYSIQGDTFEAGNIGKSPLLHGSIIKGPDNTWIITLHTM